MSVPISVALFSRIEILPVMHNPEREIRIVPHDADHHGAISHLHVHLRAQAPDGLVDRLFRCQRALHHRLQLLLHPPQDATTGFCLAHQVRGLDNADQVRARHDQLSRHTRRRVGLIGQPAIRIAQQRHHHVAIRQQLGFGVVLLRQQQRRRNAAEQKQAEHRRHCLAATLARVDQKA
jgi:hypothetical protein